MKFSNKLAPRESGGPSLSRPFAARHPWTPAFAGAERLVFVAMLLMLAACGQMPQSSTTSSTSTAAPSAEANLTINANGAAGITSALAMNYDAVSAATPGFDVAERVERVAGARLKVFALSANQVEIFRLYSTPDGSKLAYITARSPEARGPADETVSVATFFKAPHDDVAFCRSEDIQTHPGFACARSADARLWRVYKLPADYDGPSEPFDAIDPDAQIDSTLVELRWLAPAR